MLRFRSPLSSEFLRVGSICGLILCVLGAVSCTREVATPTPAATPQTAPQPSVGQAAGSPSGWTCQRREDCHWDQNCVEETCQPRETSIQGEILAASATQQAATGDTEGALSTFEQAIAAFRAKELAPPRDVACGAALSALSEADDASGRQRAASHADSCFRNTFPGDSVRQEVQAALARHRHDGLDLAAFDGAEPPETFFTDDPGAPTADAVTLTIELPDAERPGLRELQQTLNTPSARARAIQCFLADWDSHHERSASARLVLEYQSTLRDMGAYDLFEPQARVNTPSESPTGFEACLSEALTEELSPGPRLSRAAAMWRVALTVRATTR